MLADKIADAPESRGITEPTRESGVPMRMIRFHEDGSMPGGVRAGPSIAAVRSQGSVLRSATALPCAEMSDTVMTRDGKSDHAPPSA